MRDVKLEDHPGWAMRLVYSEASDANSVYTNRMFFACKDYDKALAKAFELRLMGLVPWQIELVIPGTTIAKTVKVL